VCLPRFVEGGVFDFAKFGAVVNYVTHNLNRVIDRGFYPLPETRVSNMKHRPIGIGVQGLADVFAKLGLGFASDEARQLNKDIFELMYFSSLEASMEEAKIHGPYESFAGSPLSQGLFQFNLWGVEMEDPKWGTLRSEIVEHGVRNSLVIALMPTASTSQIMGNNDAFEPFNSNLYVRRLLSGEFIVFNKYLVNDLIKNNLWNAGIKEQLMEDNGSVQNLPIPAELKDLYKTVWEIKVKDVIDMAIDRAPFVDQSQSMNLFIEDPSIDKLSKMHMYTWKSGLKTGMYYLRTKSGSSPVKFTVAPKCTEDVCTVCSS
jgi:ribonucleoside-diphosphate reductase alpha chain